MRRLRPALSLTFALAIAAGAVVAPAPADEDGRHERAEHDHDRAEQARARGEIRPLQDILALVRNRFSGDVAQIELERDHGVWMYEFKLIDGAGRLVGVKVDARTGAVIGSDGD